MKVLFMVRRQYFDAIVAGTKNEEIRRYVKRWETVGWHVSLSLAPGGRGAVAVFLCGRSVHRRRIVRVDVRKSAEGFLGRRLSAQGRRDVGRGRVVIFGLGAVVQGR